MTEEEKTEILVVIAEMIVDEISRQGVTGIFFGPLDEWTKKQIYSSVNIDGDYDLDFIKIAEILFDEEETIKTAKAKIEGAKEKDALAHIMDSKS